MIEGKWKKKVNCGKDVYDVVTTQTSADSTVTSKTQIYCFVVISPFSLFSFSQPIIFTNC